MKPIGIMQGRLVPRYQNRYQAFPVGYWEAEFHIAKSLGIDAIEFILDYNDWQTNPLMSETGISQIQKTIADTGTQVFSICADYFMQAPFHSPHQQHSEEVLLKLIEFSSKLPVRDIVIPCVDQSSLKTPENKEQLITSLRKCIKKAKEKNIFLNLETDLNPTDFRGLLEQFDSTQIKVNYDIGNSASLGYDPEEEFKAYGELISDLHIKDRILGGGSVPLGTGNARLELVFNLLKKVRFQGNICMQAARATDFKDELPLVAEHLKKSRALVGAYLS